MRRLIVLVSALLIAGPVCAQQVAYPVGVTPPVFVIPASGVSGSGVLSNACLTYPLGTTWCEAASGKLTVAGTSPMIQLGGTTNSFPAFLQNSTAVEARLADSSAGTTFRAGHFGFVLTGAMFVSQVAPTISSGFGTTPSIVNSNGTAAFTINVGTGGAATSGVVGLPAATTGWNCFATDRTTNVVTRETATSTTSVTLTAASAWTASDILQVSCFAY